jgi:hypothetical protein
MDFLENSAGVKTGMEFGFLRTIEMLKKKFSTDKIIICFDTAKNKKKDTSARYKANRTGVDKSFYKRLDDLQQFLLNFWDLACQEGEEADDVMYSIAAKAEEVVYLYSNDNDLLQCVGDSIFVLKSHESQLFVWDVDRVEEKFLVPPKWLPMFRSFVGDKSDNLEGVPRIQKKILADAILGAVHKSILDPEAIANYVSNYCGWSIGMLNKIDAFITVGLWKENYELMYLREVDYVYKENNLVEIEVVRFLQEKEIYSLKMSKQFNLIETESEF